MRMIKRISSFLLTLICILSLTVSAFAETTYMVRLYPGDPQVAKFKNGSYQEQSNVAFGSSASFDISEGPQGQVVIQDDRYAVKGFRKAGQDSMNVGNAESSSYIAASGEVTVSAVNRDQDYVVVYGIDGKMVPYTITIRSSTTGAVLRTLQYRGEEGDQPIIALPYIENYVAPGTHGRTPTTLKKGAANSWSVTYTPATATTTTTTTTTAVVGGGGNANANQNANANANANAATAAANANAVTPSYEPGLEIINDTATPLAEFEEPEVSNPPTMIAFADNGPEAGAYRKVPSWALIAGAAVLGLLIAALYWYLLFYRKKKKYAAQGEEDYDFSFLDENDNDFRK